MYSYQARSRAAPGTLPEGRAQRLLQPAVGKLTGSEASPSQSAKLHWGPAWTPFLPGAAPLVHLQVGCLPALGGVSMLLPVGNGSRAERQELLECGLQWSGVSPGSAATVK